MAITARHIVEAQAFEVIAEGVVSPYEPMAGESGDQWSYFVLYRDMGPGRSCSKVAEQVNRVSQTMQLYSTKFAWVARAERFDVDEDRAKIVAHREAMRVMAIKQAKLGYDMQVVAGMALKKWLGNTAAAKKNLAKLTPNEVVKLAQVGSLIERLAYGAPTMIEEPRDDGEESLKSIAESLGLVIAAKQRDAQTALEGPTSDS